VNTAVRNIIFWVVMAVFALLIWAVVRSNTGEKVRDLTFTEFMNEVSKDNVREVKITGVEATGAFKKDSAKFRTTIPSNYPDLYKSLQDKNVNVEIKDTSGSTWMTWVANALPMILLVGLWIFFVRQMQTGGNKALSFGKSRARLLSSQQKKVTFKDVAGVEEAKEELQEIIEFLREPQKFQKLGGRIPKGVILIGPPGTGKTLLARAIAGEANVPFFSISGSDFVEMFVGVGASRVRDLFEQGKKNAPCIVFIDEIDAVGRHRGAGLGGGHDEREQTLNQLLVEMDGFESNEGVILIAATNRPDVLDPALMRPGRFDRRVIVPRPDVGGREAILKVHTKKIPLSEDVDISVIARGSPGFSGADLANLVNEAALLAARHNRKQVVMADFEFSKDKVLMGAERKSLILSEEEKKNTAFHEAGHALVAFFVPYSDPLHKVTIIPRGMALGVTMQLPVDDKHTYTRDYLESQLAIMMGGRAAEELFLNHVTTGAGNDIEQATEMARRMVCDFGMSDLGPLAYGRNQGEIFLGRDISTSRDFSEDTAIKIDQEVKRFVMTAYSRAREVLTSNREGLVRIAEALLVREVLDGSEIKLLIDGKPLPERIRSGPPAPPQSETTEVIKPQTAPGIPGRERPQPA
jgi:cell division protease FtsH